MSTASFPPTPLTLLYIHLTEVSCVKRNEIRWRSFIELPSNLHNDYTQWQTDYHRIECCQSSSKVVRVRNVWKGDYFNELYLTKTFIAFQWDESCRSFWWVCNIWRGGNNFSFIRLFCLWWNNSIIIFPWNIFFLVHLLTLGMIKLKEITYIKMPLREKPWIPFNLNIFYKECFYCLTRYFISNKENVFCNWFGITLIKGGIS